MRCHYAATTMLQRPSRSWRPHRVVIRFVEESSYDPGTLYKTPLRSYYLVPAITTSSPCTLLPRSVFLYIPPRFPHNYQLCGSHHGRQTRFDTSWSSSAARTTSWTWFRNCRSVGEAEKKKTKKTKGILGATMVTGRKETSVWPLQQTDGRTYKRRPAVLIQVGAVVVGTW